MESDVCSAAGLFRVFHGVRAVSSRFPEMCLFLTSTASQNGDFICHHKRGVEANTELPNQLSNIFSRLRSFNSLPQLLRSRAGNGSNVVNKLLPVHADARIADHQGSR